MIYTKRSLSGNLSLTNNGSLSLFPVGSGSAFSKTLYQNNLLIVKGETHLLVDCGTRTPEAFFKLGLAVTEIRNFLITHSHADHIGGLEEVILMGRYVSRRKPRIIITKEYQNLLWQQSLRGGAAQNEKVENKYLEFEDYWDILRPKKVPGFERETYTFNLEDLKISFFRTMHYPDSATSWKDSAYSVGLLIDDRVLFTGDTRFDPTLIDEFSRNYQLDLILQDVQFFPGGVHAPFDDLKTLPPEIKAKTLLMHYPDTFKNHEQKVLEAGFLGFLEQHTFYDLI